ncbi:hypothetical protein [Pyrolobus fumarii]|uniref:hypothetical protein n=1 Tax=Pyrolobus fumarii TaxID=54252 RepID=UPI00064FCC0C|nr:hypothetical protein [Pyrolobus fumarii]
MPARGEATVLSSALLLGITLVLGTVLAIYAATVATGTSTDTKPCTISTLKVADGVLVYNSCPYAVNITFLPPGAYTVLTTSGSVNVSMVTLEPGEAILVKGGVKAVESEGIIIEVS